MARAPPASNFGVSWTNGPAGRTKSVTPQQEAQTSPQEHTMSNPTGFNLADMLKTVANVDLTAVLDEDVNQKEQAAQIDEQHADAENNQVGARQNNQAQAPDTMTPTGGGDGRNGGAGGGGGANGGSGTGVGGDAGDISQAG